MATPTPRFIVAEISKNWRQGYSETSPLLAQQFETVINHNAERGYRLVTFQLRSLLTDPDAMVETIIAVFERMA
jgi:hypothetical protein